MLANANPRVNEVPLDRSVREIVAVCSNHNVAFGEPDDFPGFMQALDKNKHLAMDFWSVVARMTKDNPSSASQPGWLLGVIVEAVTGQTIEETNAAGPAHRILVGRLANILAGEDVQGPVPTLPPKPVHAADNAEPSGKWAKIAEAARETPLTLHSPAVKPSQPKSNRSASIASVTNPAWLNDERLRLVLVPEPASPAAVAPNHENPGNDPQVQIPLAAYADRESHRTVSPGMLGGGLLLALVAAGGFWLANHRSFVSSEISGVFVRLETIGSSNHTSSASAIPPWNRQPSAAPASSLTAPSSAAAIPNAEAAHAAVTKPAQLPTQTNSVSPAPQQMSKDSAPKASRFAEPAPPPVAHQTDTTAADGPRAVVPAALMEQNLMSSRVPIYPQAAKADGIQGTVVLRATVATDGRVEDLHVIEGNPALRRAALDAVSTWRYLPYEINGQPVDASTTISVKFSLNN